MTILQAIKKMIQAFDSITSEENKHKRFDNILGFMLSMYYGGKDRQTQQILPKEEEIFACCYNVLNAKDVDKYKAFVDAITEACEQLPYTDILGEFYQMVISSNDHEQYFTPDAVCKLMAQLSISAEKIINHKGNFIINDDCCGGGRLLLAGAQRVVELQEQTKVTAKDVMLVGKDLDDRCVRITLLNMCLFGLKGYVTCGNTLTNKVKYRIFVDYTYPREKGKGVPLWFMGKISQWWQIPAENEVLKFVEEPSEYKQETKAVAQETPQTEPEQEKKASVTIDLTQTNQLTLF